MGLRRVPVDKLMAPGATCQLEWVHSLARKGRNLSTGMCRLEGAYSVHWDVLDDEEGEQEYDDELGQGCATLSVIGRGSDPSWVTSVGHFCRFAWVTSSGALRISNRALNSKRGSWGEHVAWYMWHSRRGARNEEAGDDQERCNDLLCVAMLRHARLCCATLSAMLVLRLVQP